MADPHVCKRGVSVVFRYNRFVLHFALCNVCVDVRIYGPLPLPPFSRMMLFCEQVLNSRIKSDPAESSQNYDNSKVLFLVNKVLTNLSHVIHLFLPSLTHPD